MNMFNFEQYDSLAVISTEANDQSLALVLAEEEQENRNVKQKRKKLKRRKKERKKTDRESWEEKEKVGDWMNDNGSMVICVLGTRNISGGGGNLSHS